LVALPASTPWSRLVGGVVTASSARRPPWDPAGRPVLSATWLAAGESGAHDDVAGPPPAEGEATAGPVVPEVLPILPITDNVLFPKMVFPLMVVHPDSVQLIDEAMSKDRMLGMVPARPAENPEAMPPPDHYAAIGTSAMILKMAKTPENRTQLLVQGLGRFRIKQIVQTEGKPFQQAFLPARAGGLNADQIT